MGHQSTIDGLVLARNLDNNAVRNVADITTSVFASQDRKLLQVVVCSARGREPDVRITVSVAVRVVIGAWGTSVRD